MNKVILMGRLTKEPEIRQSGDTTVMRDSLAVDRYKDGADFINLVAFGKTAEFFDKYLRKGSKILIEGRIQTGSYQKQDGSRVYTTDVVVERVEFAESKGAQGDAPVVNEEAWADISDMVDVDELPFN